MVENRKIFLEPAKSGRAKCRNCQEKINKDEMRVAIPYSFAMKDGREVESYRYYHVRCVPPYRVTDILEILQESKYLDFARLDLIKRDLHVAKTQERPKRSTDAFIEKSPSSRASCKICDKMILKGEYRVNKPLNVELEDGRVFSRNKYHHFHCYMNEKDDVDSVVNKLVNESVKRKSISDRDVENLLKKVNEIKQAKEDAGEFLVLLEGEPKSLKQLRQLAEEFGLDRSKLDHILKEKVRTGEIFQPKPGFYQKL